VLPEIYRFQPLHAETLGVRFGRIGGYKVVKNQIVLHLSQRLETYVPSNEEALENAVLTIEDPDPYIAEEAFDMAFRFEVKNTDIEVTGGRLIAQRKLMFILDIEDEVAARTWLLRGGLLKENEELSNADWPIAISQLIGDYEGSFVGDEMVQFETSVAIGG